MCETPLLPRGGSILLGFLMTQPIDFKDKPFSVQTFWHIPAQEGKESVYQIPSFRVW